MRSDRQIWGTRLARQFYRMPPRPCPYVPGRTEQNVFTELSGADARRYYEVLSQAGFRRSHGIAYRPACPGCAACVPVRIVVGEFEPSRSLRRVWRCNLDLTGVAAPARATAEQYGLFASYVRQRHGDGEMAAMAFEDYRAMVEDTSLSTALFEFRDGSERLVASCLADRLGDGLSAVYSFYDPKLQRRGLGSHMILWLAERARALELPYVYLGYWIAESPKMAYKERFQPLEGLGPEGWRKLTL